MFDKIREVVGVSPCSERLYIYIGRDEAVSIIKASPSKTLPFSYMGHPLFLSNEDSEIRVEVR